MKQRSFLPLVVAFFIGLEKLHYSLALEGSGEYEFPFKIPFHESVAAIHRAFPMQVKYMKEILHSIPVPRQMNPEPAIINKNQEDNKQPEDFRPHDEMTKSPIEEKEIRSRFDDLVDLARKHIDDEIHHEHSISSHGEYDPDSEPDETQDDETQDDVTQDDETEDDGIQDDEEILFDADDEEDAEKEPGRVTADQKTEQEAEEDVPIFPYRLSLVIQGPGNQSLSRVKTGFIKVAPDGSYKKDDLLSLMMSLKNNEGNCVPVKVPDSDNAEKQVKLQHNKHISAPVVRYRSETMDHKGTIYRHEAIRPLPIFRQENLAKKQSDAAETIQEQNTPDPSEEKDATNLPEEPENTHNTVNEIMTTRSKYGKGIQMRDIADKSKPEGTRIYPKKFDAPVNFNIKLPSNHFQFKAQEGSGQKEVSEDAKVEEKEEKETQEGLDRKERFESEEDEEKEEVKKVVIIRPGPRVFHTTVDLRGESKNKNSPVKTDFKFKKQEGSGLKEISGYDKEEGKERFERVEGSGLKEIVESDGDEEKEEVKKVVIIRPGPRVFHATVDLHGVSKKNESPVKADVGLDAVAVKKDLLPEPQFSFRQLWTPLRQILVSKIFGHPSVENVQSSEQAYSLN